MGFGLNGNTFYIGPSSTSSAGDTTSYIDDKEILVEAIIATGVGAAGNIVIGDLTSTDGAYTAGATKFNIYCAANVTHPLIFEGNPVRFPNGIWISTNSNIAATIIFKRKG